jgi:hypothetical protein
MIMPVQKKLNFQQQQQQQQQQRPVVQAAVTPLVTGVISQRQ